MNELNIPVRTKGKHKTDIKNSDLYKFYRKNIPSIESLSGKITSGSYDIKAKEYSDILKDINDNIINIIILENFELVLPYRLGTLSMKQRVVKFKLDKDGNLNTKNLSVDYKATKELWSNNLEAKNNKTLIFHTNEHTNGNRMSYWWSKKKAFVQGVSAYYFLPCRQVKRKPTEFLKNADNKLLFFETPKKTKYLKYGS